MIQTYMEAVNINRQEKTGIHRIDEFFSLCEMNLMLDFLRKHGNPAEWSSEVLDSFITQWETLPAGQGT